MGGEGFTASAESTCNVHVPVWGPNSEWWLISTLVDSRILIGGGWAQRNGEPSVSASSWGVGCDGELFPFSYHAIPRKEGQPAIKEKKRKRGRGEGGERKK